MSNLAKALTGLAALAFVLAFVAHFTGPIASFEAEGYSRASADLALIAIALVLSFGGAASAGRSL
jgi:hypothetical protein